MTKATFNLRIESDLKAKFSQKLKEREETATAVIVRAIEAYCNDVTLDSDAVTKGSNDVTTSNDVTPDGLENLIQAKIESYLESHPDQEITAIWDSLTYMGEKLDTLTNGGKSSIESYCEDITKNDDTTDNDVTLETTANYLMRKTYDKANLPHIEGGNDTVTLSGNDDDVTTSNDDATLDSNDDDDDEPETAPNTENLEPLPEETPSGSTLETAKDTAQDETPQTPPEPLNEAKSEGSSDDDVGESSIAADVEVIEDTGEAFLYRGDSGGYAVVPFSELGEDDSESELVADWLTNNQSEHSISEDDLENGGYNLEATVDVDYGEGEESSIATEATNEWKKPSDFAPDIGLKKEQLQQSISRKWKEGEKQLETKINGFLIEVKRELDDKGETKRKSTMVRLADS